MTERNAPEDVGAKNEEALQELAFGIEWSRGQFKLMLARCNYHQLRSRSIDRLREMTQVELQELVLSPKSETLFHTIQDAVADGDPAALTIWGLESVRHLHRLLEATNQVREEFRKHFAFPLILWVNDEILQQLIRLAPDFESWATITEFSSTTTELIELLSQSSERIFADILTAPSGRFLFGHPLMSEGDRQEFEQALKDLGDREIYLQPELIADVQFFLGRNAYEQDDLEEARGQYRQSLSFWQQSEALPVGEDPSAQKRVSIKQGMILLHLGLCDLRSADLRPAQSRENWRAARNSLKQCIEVLEAAQCPDLVARFITYLSEVLRYLKAWDDLKQVANQSVSLHKIYGSSIQLAADYGLLAEMALQSRQWYRAERWAAQALETLGTPSGSHNEAHFPYYLLLHQLYRLFLLKSQQKLGQERKAADNLEYALQELPRALESATQCYDPQRCLRILQLLRELYFAEGRYLEAFEIKLRQRAVEVAFGFRAFIGAGRLEPQRDVSNPAHSTPDQGGGIAPEIQTSGRQRDVNKLRERAIRPDRKLTVLYGPSGVGKSSIVHAGLIPALKETSIDLRDVVPVVVRVYTDWSRQLGQQLAQEIHGETPLLSSCLSHNQDCLPSQILAQLQQNAQCNLLTVLIFEQFEEFFFAHQRPVQRKDFYEFLNQALETPYVKVILSLREDDLHHLLEIDRLVHLNATNGDILNKNIRYYLGNLSKQDAHNVIKKSTDRSHFYLEAQLIDRLVEDLASELGEVRPIELQIVGEQLQEENINTLEEYRRSGTLPNLIDGFVEEAIQDCGPEQEQTARLVLYFLTDKNGMRPLKTKAELAQDVGEEKESLNLVLEILKKSGLVFFLPEIPHHRYQLVHDYLVPIIRQRQELAQTAETQALRQENQYLAELTKIQQQQKRADTRFKGVLIVALIGAAMGVIGLTVLWKKAHLAQQEAAIASIKALNSASKSLRLENQFEALIDSVKAAKQFQNLQNSAAAPALQSQTLNRLQQALATIRERNRLEDHSNNVLDVSFSPDGQTIATASADGTVKLWQPDGTLIQTLNDYTRAVASLSFSPDSQTLATATGHEVKLWQLQPQSGYKAIPLETLNPRPEGDADPQDAITSLSFSPDGQTLATGGTDKRVTLWTTEGKQLATLEGHQDWVLDVSFSPDGQTLASASRDQTVKLWTPKGRLLTTLRGHYGGVSGVAFSPDGELIATVGTDSTLRLWSPDGRLISTQKTTKGQESKKGEPGWVWDVSFSPNAQWIATASDDSMVTLWTREGEAVQTLRGHRKSVRSLSFSPDGETLATASEDNTVKLWELEPPSSSTLKGHNQGVLAISFSPDGETLATASEDNTVGLWNADGSALGTLKGHEAPVYWVGFSPEGQTLATASADGTLKLWQLDGTLQSTLDRAEGIESASFSLDGKLIATAGGKTLNLWNRNGSRRLTFPPSPSEINSVAFSPDGKFIAAAYDDHRAKLWNLKGDLVTILEGHKGSVNWVSFSPDGQILASASSDKTVKLWNRKGRLLDTLEGHIGTVNWVSFSAGGRWLASAGETVKLWQIKGNKGMWLTTFEAHDQPVWSVSFSPDGQTLASASADGTVVLWNLDFSELLAQGCNWIGDYLRTNPKAKGERDLCNLSIRR